MSHMPHWLRYQRGFAVTAPTNTPYWIDSLIGRCQQLIGYGSHNSKLPSRTRLILHAVQERRHLTFTCIMCATVVSGVVSRSTRRSAHEVRLAKCILGILQEVDLECEHELSPLGVRWTVMFIVWKVWQTWAAETCMHACASKELD